MTTLHPHTPTELGREVAPSRTGPIETEECRRFASKDTCTTTTPSWFARVKARKTSLGRETKTRVRYSWCSNTSPTMRFGAKPTGIDAASACACSAVGLPCPPSVGSSKSPDGSAVRGRAQNAGDDPYTGALDWTEPLSRSETEASPARNENFSATDARAMKSAARHYARSRRPAATCGTRRRRAGRASFGHDESAESADATVVLVATIHARCALLLQA